MEYEKQGQGQQTMFARDLAASSAITLEQW